MSRELKARYRGSVLGFFWSFANPAAAAAGVYVRVLVRDAVRRRASTTTRCSSSAGCFRGRGSRPRSLESSGILISGGNLIKKVMFPAEILPIVTVLSNLVHFLFGLLILVVFLIYFQAPLQPLELLWFPVVVRRAARR